MGEPNSTGVRGSPKQPAVTLCSGRPPPYIEVLLQGIEGHLPAVYENGAGLYNLIGYQFTPHPDMRFIADRFQEVQERLQVGLVASGKAYFQPGKVHCLDVLPRGIHKGKGLGYLADTIGDGVRDILQHFGLLP
jgi:hydroxymethylpyrimidine pyrophosphatase-like HAD family hydrolase